MQQFTPMEYLYIDVANQFGLDGINWDKRIEWVKSNIDKLEESSKKVKYKTRARYNKAVLALRKTQREEMVGHPMGLDATASGVALLSLLSGDYEGAKSCNLINTGNREDAYKAVTDHINTLLEANNKVTREDIKYCLMTYFYNSKATPLKVLGRKVEEYDPMAKKWRKYYIEDTPAYIAFIETLENKYPYVIKAQNLINSCYSENTLAHSFVMPDGHTVYLPSYVTESKRVKCTKLNSSFTYNAKTPQANLDQWRSLAAHVVHACDGYIVREVIRKMNKQGREVLTVHDEFMAHPCDIQALREIYVEVLSGIAKNNLLVDILEQITGDPIFFQKGCNNLHKLVLDSDYAIC